MPHVSRAPQTASPSPTDREGGMRNVGGDPVAALQRVGVTAGALVSLVIAPGVGAAVATEGGATFWLGAGDPGPVVRRIEDELRPRWVLWSSTTASTLLQAGVRIARSWDLVAVHRLLFGGWRADPARVWAQLHNLEPETIPTSGPLNLFSVADQGGGDPDDPVRPDGYLRPEWVDGAWSSTPDRLGRWAGLAEMAARLQRAALHELKDRESEARPLALSMAQSESAAELLGAELSAGGLPMDRRVAEGIVARYVGPRPRTEAEISEGRARRDREVLRHAPPGAGLDTFDLRSPGQVRALLARVGVELVDTRAWRLRAVRDAHPLVEAILAWRKAERVATTYGYGWLDQHLGADGRLRGGWTGSDGGAGRMTASAGLHNMPADMRDAVVAEAGHVFVRADLGQIEPRVLASVSGDGGLARATWADDMYAPVASELGVDRATAKVAVLGAMYGQTTGFGAQALRGLDAAYPVAMAFLQAADRAGREGKALRTYGGRLIPVAALDAGGAAREAPGRAASRGRYVRNAMVQGAAAELFKRWAVTVRARCGQFDAEIVLCLHDELLLHVPFQHGEAVAALLDDALQEAAQRWARDRGVRFVADISVLDRWSDAKTPAAVEDRDGGSV